MNHLMSSRKLIGFLVFKLTWHIAEAKKVVPEGTLPKLIYFEPHAQ